MTHPERTPADPIENLSIGKLIEVDGSHIIAELDPAITELSRVYAGEAYPIGQFGSIIKVHFGRRIIYALVSRLRMKAEYEAERGVVTHATSDERIIEADLFGEGDVLDSQRADRGQPDFAKHLQRNAGAVRGGGDAEEGEGLCFPRRGVCRPG